ncbi:hypothetical protein Rsub_11850 [Raphidocelis subcapitata]|uniref:Large ribosomal subunit protein bL34m n=1 Tax=Raphidocelis subcapitata TaxID=307507 RepID=A0A2V0PHM1_9CHLO|nr:hypothetical protein Rsub_11850 [Raphidocelis subcapitata]|eukprot:GBF99079.1 hypothetical protein Rsub_11850 [Raphidocelis subcapitata]
MQPLRQCRQLLLSSLVACGGGQGQQQGAWAWRAGAAAAGRDGGAAATAAAPAGVPASDWEGLGCSGGGGTVPSASRLQAAQLWSQPGARTPAAPWPAQLLQRRADPGSACLQALQQPAQQPLPPQPYITALGIPIALPGAAESDTGTGDGGGAGGAPSPLLCIKRTWQPNVRKRKKTHGFLVRIASKSGRRVLGRRLHKGRRRLAV